MRKKNMMIFGLSFLLCFVACGNTKQNTTEDITTETRESEMNESEMESDGETGTDFESIDSTTSEETIDVEVSANGENGMSDITNISCDELETLIQKEVESFEITSSHPYSLCSDSEREALYQGFLNGEVKAKATENGCLDQEQYTDDLSAYDNKTIDSYKALFEEEFGPVGEMNSLRIPFDDGNEMLCVQLMSEAAMGEHMAFTFQATTEGLILVSADMECYVSGLYSFYPNGLLVVSDRGNAVCHYERYYILTENCEKQIIGKYKQVDWETFCYEEIEGYSSKDVDFEDVFITQADILGIIMNDVYQVDLSSDNLNGHYEDEDGYMKGFVSYAGISDQYIVQDSSFVNYDSVASLFMKYKGLSYDRNGQISFE